MTSSLSTMQANQVFLARSAEAHYGECRRGEWPEIPSHVRPTQALATLRELLRLAGLDARRFGTADWNPMAEFIREGMRVVLKPNWVLHAHRGGHGLDCLLTHTSVLEALLVYVVKARPSTVVVGDAPVQGCDFDELRKACQLDRLSEALGTNDTLVLVKDFRRTIREDNRIESDMQQDCRPLDDFVLFDVGRDSVLEAISAADSEFRVTMYNPELMKRTHGPGRHQYLIARDIIEADVVINVPKLKTHMKACVTGSLKNLIGINGHKEYLPHHRKGGAERGGDCYEGGAWVKHFVEDCLDAANRTDRTSMRRAMALAARVGSAVGRVLGEDSNFEGGWYGNDTIWRTCLDLQRILRFGRVDGTLADNPARVVLSVTDAIIAGEGEGPLFPEPVPLGLLTMGLSTAATEWVHCLLMGLDPHRIALVREAFQAHRFPLTNFSPSEITVMADNQRVLPDNVFRDYGRAFKPPCGWKGHCEVPEVECMKAATC